MLSTALDGKFAGLLRSLRAPQRRRLGLARGPPAWLGMSVSDEEARAVALRAASMLASMRASSFRFEGGVLCRWLTPTNALADCSAALRVLTMANKLQLTDAQPQATSPQV